MLKSITNLIIALEIRCSQSEKSSIVFGTLDDYNPKRVIIHEEVFVKALARVAPQTPVTLRDFLFLYGDDVGTLLNKENPNSIERRYIQF